MVHNNFRSYQIAVQLYREVTRLRTPSHLQSQLLRAASSVVLNLAEGSGKDSWPDRKRFYAIAMGSLREVQAILDLAPPAASPVVHLADHLGACIYKLCRGAGSAHPINTLSR